MSETITPRGSARTATLGFRCSEAEAYLVKALAARHGRLVSEHLRELALREVRAEFGESAVDDQLRSARSP